MAADEAQQEPTMEEILASIRKIISEDDEPKAAPKSASFDTSDDVLELEPLDEEPEDDAFNSAADMGFESDDIVAFEPEPEPEPVQPKPQPAPARAEPKPSFNISDDDDRLIEDAVAGKAAGSLGKLMGSMSISSGSTLESLVVEMLRPMLKEWLNENLSTIVEAKVEEEVKRISRMAR